MIHQWPSSKNGVIRLEVIYLMNEEIVLSFNLPSVMFRERHDALVLCAPIF